jgi:hypothetical protein
MSEIHRLTPTLPHVIIAAVVLTPIAFAYELTESPLRSEVLDLLVADTSIRSKVYAMPAEKKRAMLEYVHLQKARDVQKDYNFFWLLLFLHDEATYQELAKKKDYSMLQDTLDPHALELIAPGMFANDQPVSEHVFPRSVLAEQAMIGMLLEMPEVPMRIKNWIRHFGDTDVDWVEHRQLFRDWWTKNEAAWRRRDFTALEPGPDMSHRRRPDLILYERKAAAVSPRPVLATPAPAVPMLSPPATPTPVAIANDSSRNGLAIIIGVVALGALGIGLLAWRRVRRSHD